MSPLAEEKTRIFNAQESYELLRPILMDQAMCGEMLRLLWTYCDNLDVTTSTGKADEFYEDLMTRIEKYLWDKYPEYMGSLYPEHGVDSEEDEKDAKSEEEQAAADIADSEEH